MLWFWLLLCFVSASLNPVLDGGDLISAVFSDLSNSDDMYSVRVLLGEARKDARMVTDWNLSHVVLSSPPAGNPEFIVIRFGSSEMTMNYAVDPYMATDKGCPECVGVFPLGSGSHFWYIYRDVVLTPSSIRLGNTISTENKIKCEFPRSEFCVADGTIYGVSTKVYFTPQSAVTYVPDPVFEMYTQKRAIDGYYPDLTIHFDGGHLTIPGTIIYNDAVGQKPTFFIDRNPDGSSDTYIGYSVIQAALLYKDWDTQTLHIKNHESRLTYSLFQLLLGLASLWLYFRWVETPPIYLIDNDLVVSSTMPVVVNIIFESTAIVFPALLFVFTGVYTVIFNSWFLGISLCVTLLYLLIFGFLSQLCFWANAVERIGLFAKSNGLSRMNPSARQGYVRLRIGREFIVETSLLCSVFIISFVMRTDTFTSYLGAFCYILYLSTFLSFITSGMLSNGFGFNVEWILFFGISIVIGSIWWCALIIEVCFPMFNFFIPRFGPEIFAYVVMFHAMFIALTFRRNIVKALLMFKFVANSVPPLT